MSYGASKKNSSPAVRSPMSRMGKIVPGNGLVRLVTSPLRRVSFRNDDNGKSKSVTTLKELAGR